MESQTQLSQQRPLVKASRSQTPNLNIPKQPASWCLGTRLRVYRQYELDRVNYKRGSASGI